MFASKKNDYKYKMRETIAHKLLTQMSQSNTDHMLARMHRWGETQVTFQKTKIDGKNLRAFLGDTRGGEHLQIQIGSWECCPPPQIRHLTLITMPWSGKGADGGTRKKKELICTPPGVLMPSTSREASKERLRISVKLQRPLGGPGRGAA